MSFTENVSFLCYSFIALDAVDVPFYIRASGMLALESRKDISYWIRNFDIVIKANPKG